MRVGGPPHFAGRAPAPATAYPPPTFRGVRERGAKPRLLVARHGCSVLGFGARVGAGMGASAAGGGGASAATFARAADALASSFARQHCLYLRPDPQWQGSFRPGRTASLAVIVRVYRTYASAPDRPEDPEGSPYERRAPTAGRRLAVMHRMRTRARSLATVPTVKPSVTWYCTAGLLSRHARTSIVHLFSRIVFTIGSGGCA